MKRDQVNTVPVVSAEMREGSGESRFPQTWNHFASQRRQHDFPVLSSTLCHAFHLSGTDYSDSIISGNRPKCKQPIIHSDVLRIRSEAPRIESFESARVFSYGNSRPGRDGCFLGTRERIRTSDLSLRRKTLIPKTIERTGVFGITITVITQFITQISYAKATARHKRIQILHLIEMTNRLRKQVSFTEH
ncbi:MAG: hypothetical protein IJJ99_03260 [Oscillospiraceae bacterium]|nr:hypothetical protein [Oscillospiraceae bacterium]